MNVSIPLGIEHYLQESGFSGSEIIVLKKLLEENFLTVREIASKTGKGNGLVHMTLKKLMTRGIVGKENFNDNPKYRIIDPQAIVAWAKKNLEEHTSVLQRKHQSFVQFMSNLSVTKSHPEIEHFSGEEGLKKAYEKLLDNRAELLTYIDPASIATDDPLTKFHAQYNRRRQVHGVFQRIIAPDSPAARRFQSRDPFEYRRTVLVRPEDYPMSFQKIIAGDTVACFDEKTQEASFIRFRKFAESERVTFERLWYEQLERDHAGQGTRPASETESAVTPQKYAFSMNSYQKVSVILFLLPFIDWIGLQLTQTNAGFFNYLYSFLMGLNPLWSGVIAMFSTKMWGGPKTAIGRAVFLMGFGMFLWECGNLVWSYHNFVFNTALPYPSLADVGYVIGTLSYFLGVAYLSEATGAKLGLRNFYAKIFVIIAPIVVLAISYYFFITIARGGVLVPPGGTRMKMILDIGYPLSDFFALAIALLISGLSFQYMSGRYTFDIVAILLGLAAIFVADFIFSYTTTVGTFYNGGPGDIFYAIALFLLSFGLLGFCKDKKAVET